jgi:hypothetical protein
MTGWPRNWLNESICPIVLASEKSGAGVPGCRAFVEMVVCIELVLHIVFFTLQKQQDNHPVKRLHITRNNKTVNIGRNLAPQGKPEPDRVLKNSDHDKCHTRDRHNCSKQNHNRLHF